MSNLAITGTSDPNSYLINTDAADSTERRGSMIVAGREIDVREIEGVEVDADEIERGEVVGEVEDDFDDGCCAQVVILIVALWIYRNQLLIELTQEIGAYFHAYFHRRHIDVQLFKRALVSMGNGATPEDIKLNIEALTRLRNLLEVSGQLLISGVFIGHEPRTDALLNSHFRKEGVAEKLDKDFKQEIIRECDKALFFQRTLSVVNIFYNTFGINGNWLAQLFEDKLSVPEGTVRYNPDRFSSSIIAKAEEIETLKEEFDRLAKHVETPQEYADFMGEIMTIPVFDPTHPKGQRELAAASGATSNARPPRDWSHALDWQNFEKQFQRQMMSPEGVQCAGCRLPIKRENMLIDTILQDEILKFLKVATNFNDFTEGELS